MSVYLKTVDVHSRADLTALYKLLAERSPQQAISHKKMPTFGEHARFVKSLPYKGWYLIVVGAEFVGATYITHSNELGIFLFNKHRGLGYAKEAIEEMMTRYEGPFLANINPNNGISRAFFEKLGFKLLQVTYAK